MQPLARDPLVFYFPIFLKLSMRLNIILEISVVRFNNVTYSIPNENYLQNKTHWFTEFRDICCNFKVRRAVI